MIAIVFRTVFLLFLLTFSLKIMGKRQLGELEVGELVSALLLSEAAVLPIDDPDLPLLAAVIPMLCIVSFEVLLSYVKNSSSFLKKAIDGEPVFLVYNGKLRQKALADNRLSLEELLTEMRVLGYADIGEVAYAILEQNGKFSVIPKTDDKTLTKNLIHDGDGGMTHMLISDGVVKEAVLKRLGYDRTWLERQLQSRHTSIKDVFFCCADDIGRITIIKKEKEES